ncbi:MAG: M48 family metalloprotease [Rubripirellula sp.]
MFDFLARKTRALRASARWFALVLVTQVFTAVTTGVVIGYLLVFPVVLAFACHDAGTLRDGQSSAHRHPQFSKYEYKVSRSFLHAFDESVSAEDRCVDPSRVFWFTSLLGIASTAAGLICVTAIEHRRIRRDGGWAIGLAMGGRRVDAMANLDQRRVINVVEEVSIAYGTTPPTVFILPGETGINVFAAGLTPEDSILCITDGAVQHLKRDEMQAVVAHEMSHLIHGDTLLGTRMTSILLGLQSIRVLAEMLFTVGRDLADADLQSCVLGYLSMLVGAVLWPFGLFGVMAASVLTMSIGRSQETVADAEAVARTRNPQPLANAMRRILGHPGGGRVRHPMTALIAPMLFVEPSMSHRWFSTHPPLQKRIAAIDPAGGIVPIYHDDVLVAPSHNESRPAADIMNLVFAGALMSSEQPRSQQPASKSLDPDQFAAASVVILSALSACDGETSISDYEFLRGWAQLGLGEARRISADHLSDDLFRDATETLTAATPPQKKRVLAAIANTISSDGRMSPEEAAMLETVQTAWQVS